MTLDDLRAYIVVLNGGTGCIFQPMDTAYTYILTAKHVIQKARGKVNVLKRFLLVDDHWKSIDIIFELQMDLNYFEHPDRDAAILKIDRLDKLDNMIRTDAILDDRDGYILAGYPKTRRKPTKDPGFTDSYRTDEHVTIQGRKSAGLYEAKVPGNPSLEEIQGDSGGAIVKIRNGYFYLAGIQCQMVDAKEEQLGGTEFSPMASFDQIVSANPTLLSELLPGYMNCFSFLKENAFILDVGALDEENIALTRSVLRDKTTVLIKDKTTPLFIKNFFKQRILLDKQYKEVLNSRELWVAWLEFLIILNVVKYDVFGEKELAEIFDSFRLLFTKTEQDWTHEIPNMIYSDYKGLKNKGLVIIGSPLPPAGRTYEIQPGQIPRLDRVNLQKDRMKTDEGISFPFDHFRFIHLDYFKRKCITDKLDEYSQLVEEDKLLLKLKDEYAKFFV